MSLLPYINDTFFLSPVSYNEIDNLICNLDLTKSNGPEHPTNNLIKIGHSIITPILTELINLCFQSGIFPAVLKTSTAIPIFKSGDSELPTN